MVNSVELENRVIPFKILLEAVSTTKDLVRYILPENEVSSLRIGVKYLEKAISDMIEKARDGLPIVGHHFAFQTEYLSCFDCVPVCIEGISYILSCLFPNGVEKYLDLISDGYGHPFHTCSSQKAAMGMTLDDLFRFDAIITPTAPCDNTMASYPFFSYYSHGKIPLILPDLPFVHSEKGIKYYAGQLKNGLENLGNAIGQKPNWDNMKKQIELENKVVDLQSEIFELKKAIPNPVDNLFNAFAAAAAIYLSGRPEKINFYEDNLAIAKARYKKKIHHGGGEEQIRCIFPYMLVFFSLELLEWLDRDLGMSVLFDIFNYNFSDTIDTTDNEKMFLGMSKKGINFPMMKQSTDFYYPFIEDCVRLAKEFSADCFVFTSHLGCKQFGSVPQILREALRDEVGIPMLLIDLDVGNQRMTSIKTIKDKIKLFTQTLL